MSEERELLPCPFCGGDALILPGVRQPHDCQIQCSVCMSGPPAFTDYWASENREAAIAMWNKRAGLTGIYVTRSWHLEHAIRTATRELERLLENWDDKTAQERVGRIVASLSKLAPPPPDGEPEENI